MAWDTAIIQCSPLTQVLETGWSLPSDPALRSQAKCFLAKDRQRLLAVIEAGFGDFREFNKIVRNIFASRTTV